MSKRFGKIWKKGVMVDLTNKDNELDLHGIRHSEVDRVVENFVLLGKTPMTIITGRSNKMTELVTSVLNRHQFKYDIPVFNVGMVKIYGCL